MKELLLLPLSHYIAVSALTALLLLLVVALWYRMAKTTTERRYTQLNAEAVTALEQQYLQKEKILHQQLREAELEGARAQAALEAAQGQLQMQNNQITALSDYKARALQLEIRLEEQQLQQVREKQLLDETKLQLFREFELAANKLFESKQQQFTHSSRSNMEAVLAPFKEQLKEFRSRVEDVYHKENSERNQLVGHIAELQKQAQKISSDANNLASALKGDNKAQGNWGEIILERLLEQSGLEKGREYETQKAHVGESGKRLKPDVIVHLPEGKDIVIDAKVSLVEYERFSSADATEEKETALRRHVDSLRAHIKGLSLKKYEQLDGVRTLDFVFIFVPVEAAYIAAIQAAPALFKEAYDKNIVLVSPSSLMVALRTVETLWRYEKQNSNAEQIALSAGKLYDQFVLLLAAVDDIGKFIDKASEAYQTTRNRLSDGRGNLVRKVEQLRELGAKTSRNIPDAIRVEALEPLDDAAEQPIAAMNSSNNENEGL